jgi:hypothetical protein
MPAAFTGLGTKEGGDEQMNKIVAKQTFKEVLKTTQKKSEEEVKEHQELVIMLSRYGQSKRFAEYLKSMGFQLTVSHLKGLDNEELKELLQRVKTSIDNKNVSNFWEELVFGVIQTGEVVTINTTLSQRLKIAGLTDALRGDDTFLDLIEQVELENQNLVYTSPYVRLVYSVATAAMKCHSINSMMEKRMKILQAKDADDAPKTLAVGEPSGEPSGESEKDEENPKEEEIPKETPKESVPESPAKLPKGILSFD